MSSLRFRTFSLERIVLECMKVLNLQRFVENHGKGGDTNNVILAHATQMSKYYFQNCTGLGLIF